VTSRQANFELPALGVGLGLRRKHAERIAAERPDVPFFEFVPENYMDRGGLSRRHLFGVAEHYPVVSHGVGLGVGSCDPLDREYLASLGRLIQETGALWASDHLCWNRADHRSSNDLLPLPFTEEAVHHTAARIRTVGDLLGLPFLVENISTYVVLPGGEMTEWEFTSAVLEEADCGLLLDVNNVYVNARNHGFEPMDFLRGIPAGRVGQMHLGGHEDRGDVCVDTHGEPVRDEVWDLFEEALRITGPTSVVIEWDCNIPGLERLLAEMDRARTIYDRTVGVEAQA